MKNVIMILAVALSITNVALADGEQNIGCGTIKPQEQQRGEGDSKRSVDPNEMSGPLGAGEKRYVDRDEWMDYTIYFENQTNATAAAQEIFVDLPMDENLDWTTLELGEIVFGDHIDTSFVGKKLARKAYLKSSYAMPGTNTFVKTTVTMKDGVLSWYLRDWDPTTVDNFPASATGGFLPPNDPETHCGEGHISYRVRVKSDAPNDAVIRAVAQITFDQNPMIETDPSWWNTVRGEKTVTSFVADAVEAAEGEDVKIAVSGGSVDAASSVQVYLTFNTAAVADVDLAKGTVGDVLPKGGLKFPLMLNWAKGEVGEKVISIPVKKDSSVEGDEFFTLQLATPNGIEMGDVSVCTVTIKDANTYLTLQNGMMSPTITATTKGDGNWFVASGSPVDEDGFPPLYHVESPSIAQGKKSTLSLGTVKGEGLLFFSVRFVGDPNEEIPSTLTTYDDGKYIDTITHADVTNVWVGYKITTTGGALNAPRNYSFVFTQGSDPNTHVEISEVYWDSLGNISPATFYCGRVYSNNPNGGVASGSGYYYYDQTLKLVAKAFPGWTFDGWYLISDDDETGERSYSFMTKSATASYYVDVDFSVMAFFSKIPYVRALADPADGGKVTGGGLCDKGNKVTLKATANKNFTFLGWRRVDDGGRGATALPDDGDGRAGSPLPAADDDFVATTATLVIDRTAKPAADSKTSTTITNVAGDVTYYAVFKSDPEVFVIVDSTDGTGAEPTGKGAGKYVAGTITGMGKYAPGKTKIALKAAANKGYVFSGWYDANGFLLTKDATYTIASMGESDVKYTAKFVTADEDKASIRLSVAGAELRRVEDNAPYQVTNFCGVAMSWQLASDALSATTIKVAGLPAGLKFTAKDIMKKGSKTEVDIPANTIYGAPTAASKTDRNGNVTPSKVVFTVTTAGKSTQTFAIDLYIDPLPAWAVGTFDGATYAGDSVEASGVVQAFTVAANGKISGKLLRDDGTWTLAVDNFAAYDAANDVYLASVIGKNGKLLGTNQVTVTASGVSGVTTSAPTLSWTAYQNLWKRADTKADMPVIKKDIKVDYYLGDPGDANNKLTLTFKKDGAVAFAGKVGGASVSGASQLVRLAEDGLSCQVTLYAPPKGTFAGLCKTFSVSLALDDQNVVTAVAAEEVSD